MTSLIERIEAATGPSRELDMLIGMKFWTPDGSPDYPAYTSSIDAAMTLVPDGAHVTITRDRNFWIVSVSGFVCRSRSIPLALCAAALRARGVE